MPNRSELQPSDLSTLHLVDATQPQGAPAMPDAAPKANPLLRTTLAPIQQMQPDQLRQFFKSGTPQFRISPPPTTAQPSINAQAGSEVKRVTDPLTATVSQNTSDVATALQSQFLGPWQATVQYFANNQVSRNGNTYLALDTNTGSQPPSAHWFLLGPSTYDNLSDGTVNVKNVQYSMANVAVQNAGFEASTSLVSGAPPGWLANGATLSYETGSPYAGTQSLKVAAGVTGGGAITSQRWTCKAGDQFFVSAAQKSDGTSSPNTILIFFNSAGTFIGSGGASHGTSTSWSVDTGTVTAPANAVSFYVTCANATSGGSGICEFDQVLVDRMVDPTTTIQAKGSTPSNLSSGFTYTSTTSSITMNWSGLTIYRADGSTTNVTNSGFTVTGLSASTTYKFFPYWDEALDAVNFVGPGSGGPTGAGSPAIAYTSGSNAITQNQNLQSKVPLSASTGFTASTTASGSGGGSGGGSGSCLHESMLVQTKRGILPIIDVEIGDQVRGESDWQTVTYKNVRDAEIFISVQLTDGEEIICTPSHPFTLPAGSEFPMKRALDLSLSDFLITSKGVGAIKRIEVVETKARKVTLTVEPSHTFFAGRVAPNVLTHNWLPS